LRPLDTTRGVYKQLDTEWQKAAQEYEGQTGSKVPCGPGCGDCCKGSDGSPFVSLPMGEFEAQILWEAMIALPESTRSFLVERARRGHSASCLLLSPDDLCLVHEGRPLWCRIYGLPGVFATCYRIKAADLERWTRAVRDAYVTIRGLGGSLITVRQLVERLAKEIDNG